MDPLEHIGADMRAVAVSKICEWWVALDVEHLSSILPSSATRARGDVLFARLLDDAAAPVDGARAVLIDVPGSAEPRVFWLGESISICDIEGASLLSVPEWLEPWRERWGLKSLIERGEEAWLLFDVERILAAWDDFEGSEGSLEVLAPGELSRD